MDKLLKIALLVLLPLAWGLLVEFAIERLRRRRQRRKRRQRMVEGVCNGAESDRTAS